MRVGIIGAGATGLPAAYDLLKAGHEAVVYERAPFIGGHASTFDVGGERLERGYHHWFTSDTDILDLLEEIGLGHTIRWIDSTAGTLYDGQIYDFVTPFDLLKFKPLSLPDRVRLGLMMLYLQRQKDWRKYEGVTTDEWLRRYGGQRMYDTFWGPMLRGKFGEDYYNQVTMAWLWGKVNTRVKSRGKSMVREMLGYPMGSFGLVFDTLADKIREMGGEVHISASANRIIVEDGGVRGLEVQFGQDDPIEEPFDAVLATTPSPVFTRLVPTLPADYQAQAGQRALYVRRADSHGAGQAAVRRVLAQRRRPLHPLRRRDRAYQPDKPGTLRRQTYRLSVQLPHHRQPALPHEPG